MLIVRLVLAILRLATLDFLLLRSDFPKVEEARIFMFQVLCYRFQSSKFETADAMQQAL